MRIDTVDIIKNRQTLFLVGSSVWLVFGEDIFGITFKPISFNVSSMPDEVLEELVTILLVHDDASCLDDIFGVPDKLATFGTELVLVDRRVLEDIFQGVIDLSVVR